MSEKEILLVEDSSDFRRIMREIFKNFLPDYHVKSFQGANELYHYMILQSSENYSGRRPALIIVDVKMPYIDGFEVLKLIRKTPANAFTRWATMPVVMLSGASEQIDINKCYEAGANSFFEKPVNFDDLKALVSTICHYWVDYNKLAMANVELNVDRS